MLRQITEYLVTPLTFTKKQRTIEVYSVILLVVITPQFGHARSDRPACPFFLTN